MLGEQEIQEIKACFIRVGIFYDFGALVDDAPRIFPAHNVVEAQEHIGGVLDDVQPGQGLAGKRVQHFLRGDGQGAILTDVAGVEAMLTVGDADDDNAARLVEAAEMLGADKFYAFFRIIVPCMLSGVVIASMLSIALIFGDFVIVNTIGGSYYSTAQMYLLKKMFISGQLTSAVIMVLFVVTLLISAAVFFFKSKTENAAGRR